MKTVNMMTADRMERRLFVHAVMLESKGPVNNCRHLVPDLCEKLALAEYRPDSRREQEQEMAVTA